jgi:exodeoxyribonuclease III
MACVRIVTANVNGVRAAARKGLPNLLTDLAADLVCLQETRAFAAQVPPLLEGYRSHWHAAERAGYSGVGLLVREGGPFDEATVEDGIGVPEVDAEGRLQHVRLGSLSVLNAYVPSGTTGDARQAVKMAVLARLTDLVDRLLAQGREVLLVGDLNVAHQNVDLTNWRSNQKTSGFLPEERAWFGDLLGRGLRDVVRELAGPDTAVYTWWSMRSGARARNVGWRLDHQLASRALARRARTFEVRREPVVSDHAPLLVTYDAE